MKPLWSSIIANSFLCMILMDDAQCRASVWWWRLGTVLPLLISLSPCVFLSVGPSLTCTLLISSVITSPQVRMYMSGSHRVHHCRWLPLDITNTKPHLPPLSPSPNKAPDYYSCGMFCVSKNINHHVLSSRMSHPTVLHVSDDWQSCVNNEALSVLTEVQPCSPTRHAFWWMLFNVFSLLFCVKGSAYF